MAEPIPIKAVPNLPTPDGITKPRRASGPARFLTDVIVDLGLADRDRVTFAIEEARRTGKTPEDVLLESGNLTSDGLARAVAERHGLEHLDLSLFQPDMTAANLISIPAAKRYEAVPVGFIDDRTLLVAMADPANVLAVDDIALLTGKEIRPAVTSREDIQGLISRLTRLDDVVSNDFFE
ncbi:MAG: type pilus assembly protein PilB, partial [Solirubrobacteraceae bacterium]|nr:type pilus assembly protein PilB [Solirubrobacteraceae bacterium]